MTDQMVQGATIATALNVMKIYGEGETEVRALNGLNAEFRRGQFTAVMGPSGSGKSTLMHVMAGLDRATSGEVMIGDTALSLLSEKELTLLRRERIGFVFQAYNLIPTLSARENMVLPLELAGRKPDADWFDQVVAAVGLGDRLTHRPNELSGGQQQRVAVARALVGQPDIIFADEPTGNLDSQTGHEILDFLKVAVRELDQTIVMVTHDPLAASYTDRAIFLTDGEITSEMNEPNADEIYNHMRSLGA
ncbi:MAG: ABC transporter ATP-binding protein [Actinomycetota bacterium]